MDSIKACPSILVLVSGTDHKCSDTLKPSTSLVHEHCRERIFVYIESPVEGEKSKCSIKESTMGLFGGQN